MGSKAQIVEQGHLSPGILPTSAELGAKSELDICGMGKSLLNSSQYRASLIFRRVLRNRYMYSFV